MSEGQAKKATASKKPAAFKTKDTLDDGSVKKRAHGKSCLICRKRKIKCDQTKPVCLACVKHACSMDCSYTKETKKSVSNSSAGASAMFSANETATKELEQKLYELQAKRASPVSLETAISSNVMSNTNNIDQTLLDGRPTVLLTRGDSTRGPQSESLMQLLNKQSNEIKLQHRLVDANHEHNTMSPLSNATYSKLSSKIRKTVRKQKMIKEFSEFKKKLESLEALLEGSIKEEEFEIEHYSPSSDASVSPYATNSLTASDYPELKYIPKMSFYDGFEQVNVLSARLLFLGPLSPSTIVKKDSFCIVLSAMINKTRDDIAKALEVQTEEKYQGLRVTARHMAEQVNIHIKSDSKIVNEEETDNDLLENVRINGAARGQQRTQDLSTPAEAQQQVSASERYSTFGIPENNDNNVEQNEDRLRKANSFPVMVADGTKHVQEQINFNTPSLEASNKSKDGRAHSISYNSGPHPGSVDFSKKRTYSNNVQNKNNPKFNKKSKSSISHLITSAAGDDEDEEAEEVFEQKFLENEGLDEMDTILQEGKIANNPLSVDNLLNKKIGSSSNSRSGSTTHLSPSNPMLISSNTSDIRSEKLPPRNMQSHMPSASWRGSLQNLRESPRAQAVSLDESQVLTGQHSFENDAGNSMNAGSNSTNQAFDQPHTDDQQKLLDLKTQAIPQTESKELFSETFQPNLPQASRNAEDDINMWRALDNVLTKIQKQNSKPQDRIPEGLFGQSNDIKGKQELDVLMRIRCILPSAKLVRMHIDNYFKSPIHGLYPILNEDWFRDTMQTVISGLDKNSDQQPKINATRRFDLSKLGSLLVLLRLSYLQCPETLEQCQTDTERFLLSHPIGPEFIDTAQMCLNLFKMLRKGILPVLHCALLLRVYRKYAPEDGDIVDGTDSETFTGLLVRSSTSIGLNTDVARSHWVQGQPMYIDQWRKCWYVVYFFDFMEALNMGNTLSIDVDTFDTKLPEFKLDPHTGVNPTYILDPQLEDVVVGNMQRDFQMTLICRELLCAITNKRQKFSVLELQSSIDRLDQFIRKEYGADMKSIIEMPANTLPQTVAKVNCFKNFVDINSLIFMVYLHIFIHIDKNIVSNLNAIKADHSVESNMELFHFYLKKVISLYIEMEPALILCYESKKKENNKVEEIFGKSTKLLVIQSCEYVLTRFRQGLYVVISRTLHFHYNFLCNVEETSMEQINPERKQIAAMVSEIISCAMDKLEYSDSICRLLSQKYFQIWRISKHSQFMFQLLSNMENNLFDKASKINNDHRNECNNTRFAIYPFKYIPHINLFSHYRLIHFQEIFSTLSSVKWNVFSNFLTPEELAEAKDYRRHDRKAFIKNTRRSKKCGSNGKSAAVGLEKSVKKKNLKNAIKKNEVPNANGFKETGFENEKNISPNMHSSQSSSTPVVGQIDIPIDEIDKFWYSTVINNSNVFAQMPNRLASTGVPELNATNGDSSHFDDANIKHLQHNLQVTANVHPNTLQEGQPHSTHFPTDIFDKQELSKNASLGQSNTSNSNATPFDPSFANNEALDEIFNNKDMLKAHVFQKLQELNAQTEPPSLESSMAYSGNRTFENSNNFRHTASYAETELMQNSHLSELATNPASNLNSTMDNKVIGTNNGFSNSANASHTADFTRSYNANEPSSGYVQPANTNHANFVANDADPSMGSGHKDGGIQVFDNIADILKMQEMFNTDFLFPGSNSYYSDEINF
ncbi:hypothetical protein ACO0QE_003946 [Hanseniaspora vineae]